MAVVQSYTKTGIDNKLSTRAPYTLVHNGGGTPDISVYPDAVTGDVIERSGDGARWDVIARSLIPAQGRVVSIAGKTGIVTLTPSDVGAAPATHTHTKAQISDLNASTSATSNSMAQRDSGGRLTVSNPTLTTHAATKSYVDTQITSGTTWANLSGKPSTFPPSTHTHTRAQISDLNATTTAASDSIALRDANGRLTVADPISDTDAANRRFVELSISGNSAWGNLGGKPATFPPSAHGHSKSEITGLTTETTNATANTLALRDSGGRISVGAPTSGGNATTKTYVDAEVTAGKAWANLTGKPSTFPPSTHTHTKAQVTGLTTEAVAATANTLALRGQNGTLIVADPTVDSEAATKKYVDSTVTSGTTWSNLSGKPSTFPPSDHTHTMGQITGLDAKFTSHTHTKAQITGLTEESNLATPYTLMLRGNDGAVNVGDPVYNTQATTKKYVDDAVTAGKAWTAITGKPSTFPPSAHTHTSDEVSNATAYSDGTGQANLVMKLNTSGSFTIATATITGASNIVNKDYVDAEVTAGKAWANLTGKPSTFPPSTHTHTKAEVTGLTTETTAATANTLALRDSSGRLTVATPTATTHATTKSYVDTEVTAGKAWANITGKPSTFSPSTHTHPSSQISDAVTNVSGTTTDAGKALKLTSTGRLTATTPSGTTDVANKSYVDTQVTAAKAWSAITGKPSTFAPSTHTHTVSSITDLPNVDVDNVADTVVRRTSTGNINAKLPTLAGHAANKHYVDDNQPWVGTQAQYDNITSKNSSRLYIISY